MLRNYLTIGLRNMMKQKGYSFIKIAGLALSLGVCLIIYLYVREDLSYDRQNKNYNHIARLLTIDHGEGVSSKRVGVTEFPLAPAAQAQLPEVINSVRVTGGGQYDLSYNDKILKCNAAFRTESSFFDIFTVKVLKGANKGILDHPGDIAITESLARKIFGDEDPIGKTVKLDQATDLHVTSVIEDPPSTSHLQYDLLRSLVPGDNEQGLKQALDNWQGISVFSYLLLDRVPDPAELNPKIQAIAKQNQAVPFFEPLVQPLSDVHLHSKDILFESNAHKADMLNVYVLVSIGVLILVLAIVNFVNLVTAKSTSRAKETGLRKVVGANRGQLITQHLSESILLTLIAGALGTIGATLTVPWLNGLYQRFADPSLLYSAETLIGLATILIMLGVLAGIYPAFVLSSFRPATVLKGDFKTSSQGLYLRKGLVVLQFTISIALIVGTSIIYKQMKFIFESDLGYNRDQVMTLQLSQLTIQHSDELKNTLLQNTAVMSVGSSSPKIGQQLGRTQIYPEGTPDDTNIITSIMNVDEGFIPTMGIGMAAGRNFSKEFNDTSSMIINGAMAKLLDWKDPIGRKIGIQTGPNTDDRTYFTIVGMVKDFHFATLRHQVEPMFMLYSPQNFSMALRLKAKDVPAAVDQIAAIWKRINPGTTFDYSFADEDFAQQYRTEDAFEMMFGDFTVLAILIALLGLFALSAFTISQRKKEIGVRKILGANVSQIVLLLSREFMLLVLIAFLVSIPIAWFAMHQWLEGFVYHTAISWSLFAFAGMLALVVAFLTMSFQTVKAGLENPINSIRAE